MSKYLFKSYVYCCGVHSETEFFFHVFCFVQALIMTQNHQESIRLGNGFIVEVDVKGVVSFDLSGKIEVSIWSRTSQSLIKKS